MTLAIVLALASATSPQPVKWELLRETRTDVYVLDHNMTLQDCAKAARLIRKNKRAEIVCAPQREAR